MLVLLLSLLWAWSLQEDPGYELHVQDSVTVQEGLCVRVPCTVSYPQVGRHSATPAYGSWFRIKGNPKGEVLMATNKPARETKRKIKLPFHLSGDPGAGDCSLSITDARREHSGHYYFHLDRGPMRHSYRSNMLIVSVRELTQAPDIWVKEPLESGCLSHLTCSVLGACDGVLAPTISWTGPALKPSGLGLEAYNSSEILLIPRPQDHGTNLTCRVTFKAGMSTQSTITLNVSYAPQNLGISISRENCTELKYPGNSSSLQVLEGESLFLLCAADSNPPAELSWFQGSPALNATPIYRSPILDLPQVGVSEQGDFTCRAQNSLGSQHVSLHLSVVYPPRPLSPSCSWEGEALQCTCSSHARPAPTLRWRLGEGLLERNHSNASLTVTSSSEGPWANSSLSLRGPLGSGLRLSCEAWNAHGKQSAAVLLLPGKSEPRTSGVLGAVGGAGSMALLSLCLCLIFRVKTRRKKAAQPVQSMDMSPDDSSDSGAHQDQSWMDIPEDHPAPAEASPISREEQELHYAFLQFPKLKPREQESINTEYSEIKTHK